MSQKMSLKFYKPIHQPTEWVAKPFFKTGFMALIGPQAIGKASLAVALSTANREGKALWLDGPKGDYRRSFFICAVGLEAQHLSGKLPKQAKGVHLTEAIKVEDEERALWLDGIFGIAKQNNPAFIFFDLKRIMQGNQPSEFLKKISGQACHLKTCFVGLTKSSFDIKTIPQLTIIKKGDERFLIKRSGFEDSPHGVLSFKIAHQGNAFRATNLKYLESLSQAQGSYETQDARFREIVAKLTASGQPVRTAELKSKARQAGISTYFLARPHWPSYGLRPIGEGFGGAYKQMLHPVEKH